ncbi:D-alanyl-D-alanine carboxypeptidase family protein [Conexibacter stalactiti]|uniref:serine-type D-Ala-D-Ala carboxypeptidase n=1 Tax=Conexibacter stalactiti TaxID=1940611 RepID=A0ABU4HKY6_9ACTN|nr:D-alanyl-D-alanine carboxypeptidase family protein [Conexibacter stalactiti]MDW5593965.1 D-alanyl-D-alanine carboxypeptidase family protein [Conexibacter stalactiti]MEC5034607.1 D-alanyl-D-alanine carboxypeptidase family protein [Conexibacter stalactiti]
MTSRSDRRTPSGGPFASARIARAIAIAIALATFALAPAQAAAKLPAPPKLSGASGAVFEASTGTPLYGVDAGERRLIASTTKIMTALVAVDELSLREVCAASGYRPSPIETQIGLQPGERMRVSDLLRALLLPSANDAAEALAVCASGSRGAFIDAMNAKARALGLTDTHFATPVGLDSAGNYSTAADLARMGIALRRNRFLARTVDLRAFSLTSGAVPRTVVNRNGLVQSVSWVDGVKTGHTNAAGYLLVASATRRGVTYVAAVTGTPSESARDADALALLRWAFATHAFETPVRSQQVFARARLKYRPEDEIDLIATRTVRELTRRDARVAVAVRAPEELQGPLPQNAVVGTLTVRIAGRVVATVPLVTATAVPEVGLFERAGDAIARPGSLIAIVVVIGGAAALLLLRRRHGTRRSRRRADMEAA